MRMERRGPEGEGGKHGGERVSGYGQGGSRVGGGWVAERINGGRTNVML